LARGVTARRTRAPGFTAAPALAPASGPMHTARSRGGTAPAGPRPGSAPVVHARFPITAAGFVRRTSSDPLFALVAGGARHGDARARPHPRAAGDGAVLRPLSRASVRTRLATARRPYARRGRDFGGVPQGAS